MILILDTQYDKTVVKFIYARATVIHVMILSYLLDIVLIVGLHENLIGVVGRVKLTTKVIGIGQINLVMNFHIVLEIIIRAI